ncbi:unnamed protein product [Fraxinus pennsylvanica]|uniref:14-3-3 domain-containing protein n=1 Tax=Fraxinus pennsylvanica TaxID=56036 RepID=A0AAD1YZ72_9LAMI|nr:unnamed protein product [Fraxinus pennsylvanica]
MALANERVNFAYIAKLAEQAERYDEMVDAMKKVAKLNVELTVEERNLLSVGQKVETELSNICTDVMAVIDEHLIPSSSGSESTVFFYKMKGDYYRYLAEFKSGSDRKEAAEESLKAYQAATMSAESDLLPAHPICLGLALNFSVFYYEIMNSPERACRLAKQAFDEAISELDTLSEES